MVYNFIMENPIKMDNLGVPQFFGKIHKVPAITSTADEKNQVPTPTAYGFLTHCDL